MVDHLFYAGVLGVSPLERDQCFYPQDHRASQNHQRNNLITAIETPYPKGRDFHLPAIAAIAIYARIAVENMIRVIARSCQNHIGASHR
jgi:hypothetical protein